MKYRPKALVVLKEVHQIDPAFARDADSVVLTKLTAPKAMAAAQAK